MEFKITVVINNLFKNKITVTRNFKKII